MKDYSFNIYGLEEYSWDVMRYLFKRVPYSEAERITQPLWYWVSTGRITTEESKRLVKKPPYMVGRVLAKHYPGSIDEALKALRAYVWEGSIV